MTMTNAIAGRAAGDRRQPGPLAAHVRGHSHPHHDGRSAESPLARGLGWFSVGLGLSQLLAPREVARLVGVEDRTSTCTLMRMLGLRELASGIGLLADRRTAGWLWARVAGDVMDVALLGAAMAAGTRRPDRTVAATAAVLGVTVADLYEAARASGLVEGRGVAGWWSGEVHVRKAITVNKPAEEVYRFWRDFRNLPRFLQHLQSVEVTDDRRSHWRTKGPAGMSVEWDAEIVEDRPGEVIAWRSVEGSQVDNEGSVRFVPAPGGRGTEVHVELNYNPPAGPVGSAIARLFGESADQQIYDDLRAFKQVIETGEVVVSEATVGGYRGKYWQRPAQPPEGLPADWPALED